jgi:hypothetical protein
MKIVYRKDGCVDFNATKAVHEGTSLTPEEFAELGVLVEELLGESHPEESLRFNQSVLEEIERRNKHDEFWSDPCWSEPLFSHPL